MTKRNEADVVGMELPDEDLWTSVPYAHASAGEVSAYWVSVQYPLESEAKTVTWCVEPLLRENVLKGYTLRALGLPHRSDWCWINPIGKIYERVTDSAIFVSPEKAIAMAQRVHSNQMKQLQKCQDKCCHDAHCFAMG